MRKVYNKKCKKFFTLQAMKGVRIMKNTKWKADEMEMAINFKSTRNAFVFSNLALLIYCIYGVIAMEKIPVIPFVILCVSCALFFISKLYLSKMMTKGNYDEE